MNYSKLQNETGLLSNFTDVASIITKVLPYVFYAAGLLVLVYLVLGGIQLITSGGDPKAIEMAQKKITGAIIGFVILFLSYWLAQAVGLIVGVPIFLKVFSF